MIPMASPEPNSAIDETEQEESGQSKPGAGRAVAKTPTNWKRLGLKVAASAATGFMMVFGSPDYFLWWLGFFAWLPWLWAIEGEKPMRALLIGWVAGFIAVFVGYNWLTELLSRFAGMGRPAALGVHAIFALWHGLQWGISAALVNWARRRTGRGVLLIVPLAWTATEAALPNLFPNYMGLMWSHNALWIQVAEIGSVTAVAFVMLAINAALYASIQGLWAQRKDAAPFPVRPVAAFVAWMVLVPAYGAMRMAQVDRIAEQSEHLKFAVVQGNFGIKTYGHPKNKRLILAEQQRVTAELQQQGAEVGLWGETAYPYLSFSRQSTHDAAKRRKVQRGFDIPLIFGAITRDATGENPYLWNTALVLDSEGNVGEMYDKNFPLMFGESVPNWVDREWYLKTFPSASYINPGTQTNALEVAGFRHAPLICYEDILPRFARQAARDEVHVFVNLTNDSWFGKTAAQSEHLGLAAFRAVEHRKGLLRSVNAGISAYVDPAGRIVQQTRVTDSDNDGYEGAEGFVADVPMMDPEYKTPYYRFGETFNVLCWLALLGLGFFKPKSSSPESRQASV